MATLIPSRLSIVGALRAGNMVEVRWISGHPMETGFRVDDGNRRILRHLITQIRVLLDGQLVMELEPGSGMSANPYFAFDFEVPAKGGTLRVEWLDDAGNRGSAQALLVPQP